MNLLRLSMCWHDSPSTTQRSLKRHDGSAYGENNGLAQEAIAGTTVLWIYDQLRRPSRTKERNVLGMVPTKDSTLTRPGLSRFSITS